MIAVPSMLIPLYLALLVDLTLGDPPNRYHPVAWMGSLIMAMRRLAERGRAQGRWSKLAWGIGLVGTGLVISVGAGLLIEAGLARLPKLVGSMGAALVLKSTFSVRGLAQAARRVGRSLAAGDLAGARGWLYQHLVSRETGQLDESAVAAATVESVAENASDSVIAPLFLLRASRSAGRAGLSLREHGGRHRRLSRSAARVARLGGGAVGRSVEPGAGAVDGAFDDVGYATDRRQRDAWLASLVPRRSPNGQPERRPSHECGGRGAGRRTGESRALSAWRRFGPLQLQTTFSARCGCSTVPSAFCLRWSPCWHA